MQKLHTFFQQKYLLAHFPYLMIKDSTNGIVSFEQLGLDWCSKKLARSHKQIWELQKPGNTTHNAVTVETLDHLFSPCVIWKLGGTHYIDLLTSFRTCETCTVWFALTCHVNITLKPSKFWLLKPWADREGQIGLYILIVAVVFFFFKEYKAWYFMLIICPADDSREMPSLIFSDKILLHKN